MTKSKAVLIKLNSLIESQDETPKQKALSEKYEVIFNNGTKYFLTKKASGKAYLLKYDDPTVEVVVNLEDLKEEQAPSVEDMYKRLVKMNLTGLQGYARRGNIEVGYSGRQDKESLINSIMDEYYGDEWQSDLLAAGVL